MKGGGGLEKRLKEIAQGAAVKARVGILENKSYPDGESVAQVGFWNEYGYEGTVEARAGKIYKSMRDDGTFNKNGKFVKQSKANFVQDVIIPAHKVSLPARPFFRSAISKNQKVLPQMIAKLFGQYGAEKAIKLACEYMTDEFRNSVMTWTDPPNAPSTIRSKGYNSPLRGKDRLLRNSFSYEITK